MKSYDELTNNLLERRDAYVAEQRKKRKTAMNIATSLCCFCMVVLLGFGAWNSGLFNELPLNQTPDETIGDALYPGIKDTFDDKNGESATNPAANNKIVIHNVSSRISSDMAINLGVDDFLKMTKDEIIEYYGVNFFPDVPADIELHENQQFGIYKRDGGAGEVYWDQNALNYSNDDFSRLVYVEVAKGSKPFRDVIYFDPDMEKSVINNYEVMLGQIDGDIYFAEFMYNNVGFVVHADGLTEGEFVAIIESIIK